MEKSMTGTVAYYVKNTRNQTRKLQLVVINSHITSPCTKFLL